MTMKDKIEGRKEKNNFIWKKANTPYYSPISLRDAIQQKQLEPTIKFKEKQKKIHVITETGNDRHTPSD